MYIAIYLCALLCIVAIVICAYHATNARRNAHPRRLLKATRRFDALLQERVASGDYHLPGRVVRCLRRTINLEAFSQSCKKLGPNERRRVLLENQQAIVSLQLCERSTTVHAYFAYLLRDLAPFNGDEGAYGDLMLRFLDDDSVYARENALRAIYSFGDARLVESALTSLSSRGVSHNQKLVSDGLLTFGGDEAELAELLMSHYDELLECYRNSLVDYLNHKGIDAYDERLIKDAKSGEASLDTECAIIRKINKVPSERNLAFVEDVVKRYQDGDDWEPVAVAVAGLRHYEGNTKVKELLKDKVTSRNWYIRKNAAAALASIGLTKKDIDEIDAKNDRFAMDAIRYERRRVSYA